MVVKYIDQIKPIVMAFGIQTRFGALLDFKNFDVGLFLDTVKKASM